MPTIRQYAQVTGLVSTDAFVIDRIGMGTVFIEAANLDEVQGGVISSSGGTLVIGAVYAVASGSGAFSVNLPAVSTVLPGQYIEISDLNYNLGVNNLTVTAFTGDLIYDHAVSAASTTLNISNTITRFTALSGGWRIITYGS